VSEQFFRKRAVAQRYSVDPRSVDRMWRDGRLPAPEYLGRLPIWRESKLDANDRAATRRRPAKNSPAV
jgi:predicted DNA-binding transcriptional regulator AlpA